MKLEKDIERFDGGFFPHAARRLMGVEKLVLIESSFGWDQLVHVAIAVDPVDDAERARCRIDPGCLDEAGVGNLNGNLWDQQHRQFMGDR
jgi:hypothetical protein